MYSNLFSTYESTDSPPIITKGYKDTKSFFDSLTKPDKQKVKQEQNLWSSVTFPKPTINYIFQNTEANFIPSGNSKLDYFIQYFVNKVFMVNFSCFIFGYIMQESGGNISIVSQDGNNSYGLVQWTGPRKVALFNKYGTRPTLQQQLDFIWEELNTTHRSALSGLRNSNTVEEATKVFMDKFERPNKKYANFERRLRYANS